MILNLSSLVAAQMGRSVGPPRLAVGLGGSVGVLVGVGTGRSVGSGRSALGARARRNRVGRSGQANRFFFLVRKGIMNMLISR